MPTTDTAGGDVPHTLAPESRELITEAFHDGEAAPDFFKHLRDFTPLFSRDPDRRWTEGAAVVLDEARRKFTAKPSDSDGWLAPRLHATLRLTRREAADPDLWLYLAAVRFPDYIRWRWPVAQDVKERQAAILKRYVLTNIRTQALARLWWGAELTRNGSDYADVPKLYVQNELPDSFLHYLFFRSRPAALAVVRFFAD